MKFVTRARARVDRIACAWLVRRFIDPAAEILYVPRDDVMRVASEQDALPFDVPGVTLGHHGELCSFDSFLKEYNLTDPALLKLAAIVRGADTDRMDLAPQCAGFYAIATGFQSLSPTQFRDDHESLRAQSPMYDALYEFCKSGS